MTSPNEPGYPRSADGSANGSIPGADSDTGSLGNAMGRGHITDPGDVPPWQRGPAARAQNPQPRSPREPTRPEPHRGSGVSGHTPGLDARLNRFISGGSAAPASAPEVADQTPPRSEPARNESALSEAYASELPDLSGAIRSPRSARLRPNAPQPPARACVPQPSTGSQPAARGPGTGQHADPPDRPVERAQGFAGAVGGAVLRVDDRRRVPVSGARRHGCVEQAEQQRRRPAHQRRRAGGGELVSAAPSSAAPR